MNSGGVFDIRRLVEQAQSLTTPVVPNKEHPIGLRLSDNHSLSPSGGGTGGPRLRLPKQAGGLRTLREIVARDVLDLTPDETQTAWHFLLNKPTLCTTLRAPTISDLLELGFPVSAEDAQRIRAVAIAIVLRQSERDTQGFQQSHNADADLRIAAAGRLVVVTSRNNSSVSVDAWADIRWVRSARALSRRLESLRKAATPSAQRAGSRRSAMLLLGDELSEAINETANSDMEQVLHDVAAIHSYDLQVLRNPRRFAGGVLDTIRNTPPSLLIIAASPGSQIDVISSAYREAATNPRISNLGNCSATELVDDFREALGAAAGVSPALQLRPQYEAAEVEKVADTGLKVPGIWPVKNPGQQRLHSRFGIFIENLDDGRWYTRDQSGHADSVIKRYRRISRQLEHEADLAIDGKQISKHKGYVGAVVSLDEMRGV